MPLPNLEMMVPHFTVTIPSTQQEVTFRPFLVKEEKILLIALESKDEKVMLDSIIQVITSCAISPFKVETLANFDIEYIFLQLRSRSVNEEIELSYRCHNLVPLSAEEVDHYGWENREQRAAAQEKIKNNEPVSASCNNVIKIKINIDDVKIQSHPDHTRQIYLTDTLGVNMRYPNFKMAKSLLNNKKDEGVAEILQSLAMCIESVFDGESVYTNFTPKEIQEWLEKLTQPQFVKLQAFFETMPKLAHDFEFHCEKCDYKEKVHIEGLPSFFG